MELIKTLIATCLLGGMIFGTGVVAHIVYNLVMYGWGIIG